MENKTPGADQPPASAEQMENDYDDVVEGSFPASDPPPGVIKLGPAVRGPAVRRDRAA